MEKNRILFILIVFFITQCSSPPSQSNLELMNSESVNAIDSLDFSKSKKLKVMDEVFSNRAICIDSIAKRGLPLKSFAIHELVSFNNGYYTLVYHESNSESQLVCDIKTGSTPEITFDYNVSPIFKLNMDTITTLSSGLPEIGEIDLLTRIAINQKDTLVKSIILGVY